MLWFRKKTTTDQVTRFVEINSRVLLEFQGTSRRTVVEDAGKDQISVGAPQDKDGSLLLNTGDQVTVAVPGGLGLRTFSCKVIGYAGTNVPLLILGDLQYKGFSERRRYPRLRERIVIQHRRVQADGSKGLRLEGTTHDISAGGLSFAAEHSEMIRSGDKLEIELPLPEYTRIKAAGRVTKVIADGAGSDSESEVAVRFDSISEVDRRAIAEYVDKRIHEVDLKRRAAERIRLDPPLQVACTIAGSQDSPVNTGIAQDLSPGGMRLALDTMEDLSIGADMTVRVTLPDKTVDLTCKVIIATDLRAQKRAPYRIGVKFIDLKGPGYRALNEYYRTVKAA